MRRPLLRSALSAAASAALAAGALSAVFAILMLAASPAIAGQELVRVTNAFGQTVLVPASLAASVAPQRAAPRRMAAAPRREGLPPAFERRIVPYITQEAPGTIVVNTGTKHLYLVLEDGMAMRYGIGVARFGFEWSGRHTITAKREWPDWTPPTAMLERQPGLPTHMPGGPDNPLGARALYIGQTLYRIHGTSEPWTIGQNVSSGCIRLTNEDVIDLYSRVAVGTQVVVI